MIKKIFFLVCFLGLFQAARPQSAPTGADQKVDTVTLFRSGEKGFGNYRIPSIVTTLKGTLLAFCEGRKKPGDAGDIDLLYRRSTNNGLTWSEQKVIWNDSANTCGNPCAVVDRQTGVIWLLMTHNIGTDKESAIVHKCSAGTRTVWVCNSKDDGRSWTAPVEITGTTKDPKWGWYATGPGIGIQIRYGPNKGRLVIPCDHSYDLPKDSGTTKQYGSASHVIFSDDHGRTWQLGGSILPKVNECQVVEVADGNGTLLMNMRSNFGQKSRTQALSYDGGLSWTSPVDVPQLVEPVCQGSILRYSFPGKSHRSCLLFLNPASTSGRHNLTIRCSYDEGKTWPVIKTLYASASAYSCMTVLKNGSIGCLYEAGIKNAYERIVFEIVKPNSIIK